MEAKNSVIVGKVTQKAIAPTLDRALIISRLVEFRQDWEDEGEPLIDMEASVGFVLYDLAEILSLTPEETRNVLGPELCEAIEQRL